MDEFKLVVDFCRLQNHWNHNFNSLVTHMYYYSVGQDWPLPPLPRTWRPHLPLTHHLIKFQCQWWHLGNTFTLNINNDVPMGAHVNKNLFIFLLVLLTTLQASIIQLGIISNMWKTIFIIFVSVKHTIKSIFYRINMLPKSVHKSQQSHFCSRARLGQ